MQKASLTLFPNNGEVYVNLVWSDQLVTTYLKWLLWQVWLY